MKLTRIFDLLENLKEKYFFKDDILAYNIGGKWKKYSVDEYYSISHNLACGFLALGLKKGDKVITITNNRPEWDFVDMATGLAEMVHVPVYPTLNHHDLVHVLNHSDARLIIIGSERLYYKIAPIIKNEVAHSVDVVLIDESSEIKTLQSIIELGIEQKEQYISIIEHNKKTISGDTLASIIYTSGTTGTPKGVMLSHYNMLSNSHAHAILEPCDYRNKAISFLPLCHIYERGMHYDYQEVGMSVYYAEGLSTLVRDMCSCHADAFCAVPRVLEMFYKKYEAAGKKLRGFKRILFDNAWHFAIHYNIENKSNLYQLKHRIYDELVYSKWREAMGGHRMMIISGGSAIQTKILNLFNACNHYMLEGYGMTETSPVIAVNYPGNNMVGTVGKIIQGIEVEIAADGEILTRGPHVMLGYYKDTEGTKNIIDEEGWLHTGDIGEFVEGQTGRYLKVTDRKKELFKLRNGKYIAPQVLENILKESQFIENCIVVGADQKFASAIIVPDFDTLKVWAKHRKVNFTDNAELVKSHKVIELIHKEVTKINSNLAPHEQIKRERIVAAEWTVQNDMLSQTLKLKRRQLLVKYDSLISEIYSEQ